MLNVKVIAVGKLKEKFLIDGVNEYSKRLMAFCKFSIVELSEYRCADNPSASEINKVIAKEGMDILNKVGKNDYVIAMCIEGKNISSEDLSSKLSDIALDGKSNVTFIIGGSFGLSEEVKKRADFRLSVSKMTFPHQLFRVMLCEQIYRAFQISSGGKYHK